MRKIWKYKVSKRKLQKFYLGMHLKSLIEAEFDFGRISFVCILLFNGFSLNIEYLLGDSYLFES